MQITQNLRDIGLNMTLMALDVLRKMPGNRENREFFYKIEFLRTNSYKMRKDSMKVTFEVDSTQLDDYLLILDLVTKLWRSQIMSSENAIFVKISIFDTQ